MPTPEPERILVVPFADGIGDFVLLLPLLAAIGRRYPTGTVTVAASARSTLLLPEQSRVQVQTPRWLERTPGPRGGPLRRLAPQAVLAQLAGLGLRVELGRFDRTLNLFHWWESGMDFARYWTPQLPARGGAVHTLDFLADRLATELGQPLGPAERRPVITPRPAATAWASRWWADQGLADRSVVGLVPASNMAIKRWPLTAWAALARGLRQAGQTVLVFLPPGGDPADRLPALLTPMPLIVRAPLDRVAALIARCRLVIGVDTGLLHLAPAVGTAYLGLFGPTNPAVTGPYDRSLGRALVAPFAKPPSCTGCWRHFKYEDDRCRTLAVDSCLAALSPSSVLAASRELLQSPVATYPLGSVGDA